ncbi:uncharacterized protein Dyak_GE25661 [Drosophila yakuba]|uniref:PH domain-containing protein n=1 Tax=Drosophila yakuba TaxID=7245 RepID=A0A0R1E0U0_DROYA|nr:uncharacterized protein Dyak_GE25661 [Drosophila yakuba]
MQQPATPSTPVNNAPSAAPVAGAGPAASAAAGASSTPIRINSAKQHGAAGGGDTLVHPATPHSHSMPGTPQQQPQSSSVPTGGHLLQLQAPLPSAGAVTPSGLGMGASNQSLGVSVGAASSVSGISITPPNSAGLRQSTVFDFKFKRRPSLKVLMTKLPSTDSLSNSPAPSSPGIANWASDNRDGNLADKSAVDAAKLNRKESYKAQRKNYRREKKRVASELMNSLQDPAVIVLADWLKVRGTLKSWTKLWCVLKPGLLLIYKSQKTKSSHWVGTVMLTSCQVIERPSKKDGFCFKLFHPLEQSIWAPRGPDKETIGAVVQPLPTAYLIFRAPSQAAGKCWMDALELSLRCSALLLRSNSSTGTAPTSSYMGEPLPVSHETQWSEADYEKHFNDHGKWAQFLALPSAELDTSRSDTSLSAPRTPTPLLQQLYSSAVSNWERTKRLPRFGHQSEQRKTSYSDASSAEQGMGGGLSMLQRKRRHLSPMSKSMSLGATLCNSSSSEDDDEGYNHSQTGLRPVSAPPDCLMMPRFRLNVKESPPGIGTQFPKICLRFDLWLHMVNPSAKYPLQYSAFVPVRQVGNDPPIFARFRLLEKYLDADSQNEAPNAVMSGLESESESDPAEPAQEDAVEQQCVETSYVPFTEEEFGEQGEQVEELAEENKSLIWCIVKQVRPGMDLSKRYMVPLELQENNESQRLWHRVSEAIAREDQVAATEEKTVLEERRRADAKERVSTDSLHMPDLFELDSYGQWLYKYADLRPWDSRSDVRQYECQFKVLTQTRHKSVPIVHGADMIHPLRSSIETLSRTKRQSPAGQPLQPGGSVVPKAKNKSLVLAPRDTNSDSSQSPQGAVKRSSSSAIKQLALAVDQVNRVLELHTRQLNEISQRLERMQYSPPPSNMSPLSLHLLGGGVSQSTVIKSLVYALIGLTFSLILRWLFK